MGSLCCNPSSAQKREESQLDRMAASPLEPENQRTADRQKDAEHHGGRQIRKDKERQYHHSEKEIDKTVEDTFPASDPPNWY